MTHLPTELSSMHANETRQASRQRGWPVRWLPDCGRSHPRRAAQQTCGSNVRKQKYHECVRPYKTYVILYSAVSCPPDRLLRPKTQTQRNCSTGATGWDLDILLLRNPHLLLKFIRVKKCPGIVDAASRTRDIHAILLMPLH